MIVRKTLMGTVAGQAVEALSLVVTTTGTTEAVVTQVPFSDIQIISKTMEGEEEIAEVTVEASRVARIAPKVVSPVAIWPT
jgi:hypothetical protein